MIFDFRVVEKTVDKCVVRIGIASEFRITNISLSIQNPTGASLLLKISSQTGIQTACIENLKKGTVYTLCAAVRNEKEGETSRLLTFTM